MKNAILIICSFLMGFSAISQDIQPIKLLPPQLDKGKSLMQALQDRHSTREFADKELSLQELSNLLWAANGINRQEAKKRTAPTAMNWQDIDVYVFLKEGIFYYDALAMELKPLVQGDKRSLAGTQPFVAGAPVNLVLVSDYARMGMAREESKPAYASADAAFVGENVYLFCAAFDLNCVLRASIDKDAIAKLLNLRPEQHAVFGITIGFPK